MSDVATAEQPTETKYTIWVPSYFWHDHEDRCPSDDAENGMADRVREAGNRVLITGTAKQIECLRSDAEYYCDRWGPDEAPQTLKRSAAATLNAIDKQVSAARKHAVLSESATCA